MMYAYLIDDGVSWNVFVDLYRCWEIEKYRGLLDICYIDGEIFAVCVHAICRQNCNNIYDVDRIRW